MQSNLHLAAVEYEKAAVLQSSEMVSLGLSVGELLSGAFTPDFTTNPISLFLPDLFLSLSEGVQPMLSLYKSLISY